MSGFYANLLNRNEAFGCGGCALDDRDLWFQVKRA